MRCDVRGLSVVLPLVAFAPCALADEYPPPIVPEAAKLELVEQILRGSPFSAVSAIEKLYSPQPEMEPGWCEAALDAFRTRQGVTAVEPLARAARYSDPVFKPWQDRCPALAMNAWLHGYDVEADPARPGISLYKPRGWPYPNADIAYGTQHFALYHGDFDNTPRNGEETLFYSERTYSFRTVGSRFLPALRGRLPVDRNWNDLLPPDVIRDDFLHDIGLYVLVELDPCRTANVDETVTGYDTQAREWVEGYAGIVLYRSRYYFYQLGQIDVGARYYYELEAVTAGYSFGLSRMHDGPGGPARYPAMMPICEMEQQPREKQ